MIKIINNNQIINLNPSLYAFSTRLPKSAKGEENVLIQIKDDGTVQTTIKSHQNLFKFVHHNATKPAGITQEFFLHLSALRAITKDKNNRNKNNNPTTNYIITLEHKHANPKTPYYHITTEDNQKLEEWIAYKAIYADQFPPNEFFLPTPAVYNNVQIHHHKAISLIKLLKQVNKIHEYQHTILSIQEESENFPHQSIQINAGNEYIGNVECSTKDNQCQNIEYQFYAKALRVFLENLVRNRSNKHEHIDLHLPVDKYKDSPIVGISLKCHGTDTTYIGRVEQGTIFYTKRKWR